MRQLATIQTIAEIQPIPNADAIEKVRIGGWWCVAKKGEFQTGSPCVYFEIDSLLPSDNPAFSFMERGSRVVTVATDTGEASGYRLRTVRLRGQISQGLALPLSALGISGAEIGQDVSELLRIVKWEPPISKQPPAFALGPFPSFIPKTDEERVQNLDDMLKEQAGTPMYVTEKLDGMSVTIYRTAERFGVCSRNLELKEGANAYWNAATTGGLPGLPVGFAVQGEIIGEAIQENPLKIKGQRLYVFSVYNISDGRYLDYDEFLAFTYALEIPSVPIVESQFALPSDVTVLIEMADGKSAISPSEDREGLVFRPLKERRAMMRGSDHRFSFKAISNKYLLKEKE